MNLRTLMAYQAALLTKKSIRVLGLGKAESAPGLLALKLDPQYIFHRSQLFTQRYVISGTNGKTTTTHLISSILKSDQLPFITNSTGSNLMRGIASALVKNNIEATRCLWEADEAALIPIATQVHPTHLLITNLFRDQLDRYGEVDSTLKKWKDLLQNLPSLSLILNADDPALAFMGLKLKNKHRVIYYGINSKPNPQAKPANCADSIFCPVCYKELHYSFLNYSHLGEYACDCGFKRPKLDFVINDLRLQSQSLSFSFQNESVISPLTGFYNAYNVLAALALTSSLSIPVKVSKKAIADFTPVNGRQEKLIIKNKSINIVLVKNPTGFNQTLSAIQNEHPKLTLLIAINDYLADGKDVSWLWDVDFESIQPKVQKIIITGSRCFDMGLRLKYANFTSDQYCIESTLPQAIDKLLNQEAGNLYVLPTYTALGEIRKHFLKGLNGTK